MRQQTKYMTKQQSAWYDEVVEVRQYLHQHPELSGEEKGTADYVAKKLKALKPTELIQGIGGCGLVAIYDSGQDGPSVLFRAELDALPIAEINDMPYRSKQEGVSHKCGHDGHTATMLGFAHELAAKPPRRGRVMLLFQPAEEIGAGAGWMLEDPQFERLLPIDYAFAYHNLPGFPLGQIVCKPGPFSASVQSLIVRLHGKTAHAGEPENGINPAMAISEIIREAEIACKPALDAPDFAILTPVHICMGEVAYGVSAGYGEVHLTIRTWTETEMRALSTRLLNYISRLALKFELRAETEWTNVFRANKNDQEVVDIIEQAAADRGMDYVRPEYPFKWGEDFGQFTQRFKGGMFGIGAGVDHPALHNPDYDFPDEIIKTGVQLYRQIVNLILN